MWEQELSQKHRIPVLCLQPLLSGKAAPACALQGTKAPSPFRLTAGYPWSGIEVH